MTRPKGFHNGRVESLGLLFCGKYGFRFNVLACREKKN